MRDKVMDDIARKIFLNYEEAKGWYTYDEESDITSQSTYENFEKPPLLEEDS